MGQNHCSAGAWEVQRGKELLWVLRFTSHLVLDFICSETFVELVSLCIAATCLSQHFDFLSPLCRAAQGGLRGSAVHMQAASATESIGKPSAHTQMRRFPWFCERKGLFFSFFFSFLSFLPMMKPYVRTDNSARNVVFIKGVFPTLPQDRAPVEG